MRQLFACPLGNFEKAASVFYAEFFHRRRDREAYRAAPARRIGYDEIFGHRVHSALDRFDRSVKRLQVDANVSGHFFA